jgi:hypothetical protein
MVEKVSAVIIPCSSRKRLKPEAWARAVSVPRMPQVEFETAWRLKLASLTRTLAAKDLYCGRGASLGRQAAHAATAPLYMASAGLGLVRASEIVPTYGITVARRGEDSVPKRIVGGFDPGAWWSGVSAGPMSTNLERLMSDSTGGLTLVALSGPYAELLKHSLSLLPDRLIADLRIFGWRLHRVLPPILHNSIMGYDARLERVLPGTQTDFAQRALAHFVQFVLPLGEGDAERHRRFVSESLTGLAFPHRVARPRASDPEILNWLRRPEQVGGGVGSLLRRIRNSGIACEQSRFSRLYAKARDRVSEGGMGQ